MERRLPSDKQWALMAPHCLGKPGDAEPRGTDKRLVCRGRAVGSCAQAAPGAIGPKIWLKRFHDEVKADIWQERFDAVSGQPDMQYAMADATIEKVHRHGPDAGPKVRL